MTINQSFPQCYSEFSFFLISLVAWSFCSLKVYLLYIWMYLKNLEWLFRIDSSAVGQILSTWNFIKNEQFFGLFSSEATLKFTMSVSVVRNVIFSASIKDRQLKFLVKIPKTYAHLYIVLSVCLLFRELDRILFPVYIHNFWASLLMDVVILG